MMINDFFKLSGQNKAEVLLFALMFGKILQIFLCSVWARVGFSDVFLVNDIIIIMLVLASMSLWKFRIYKGDVIALFALILFYYLSSLFYPDSTQYIEKHSDAFIHASVFVLIGLAIDIDKLKTHLHLFCRIAVIGFFMYIRLMSSLANNAVDLQEENMYLAYLALPTTLYVLWQCLEKFNMVDFVLSIVGSFLIMSMGSRGPIMCIAFFLASYFIFFKTYKHSKLVKSLIAIIASLFYYYSDILLSALLVLISSLGLSTRAVESMMTDAMFDINNSSGRDIIWEELLKAVQRGPAFGYGLGADERLTSTGFFAHNVVLSILVSFGWLLGSLVLLYIIYYFAKALWVSNTSDQKVFFLLLFTVGFVSLLFSGIFLDSPFFFMLIGYAISLSRQKHTLVTL